MVDTFLYIIKNPGALILTGVLSILSIPIIFQGIGFFLNLFKNIEFLQVGNFKIKSKEDNIKVKIEDVNSFIENLIDFVDKSKEDYMDNMLGIKCRIFNQSISFMKDRLNTVKDSIIEEYKILYMYSYHGVPDSIKDLKSKNDDHLRKTNNPPNLIQINNKTKLLNPCTDVCLKGCNSGVTFFESNICKDFEPIIHELCELIEKNHLINRKDREYEEEVATKAKQITTQLRSRILSYNIPIDNDIAKKVIDIKTSDLEFAISDSLRRSRTLSKTKRDLIKVEQKNYLYSVKKQVAQLEDFLKRDNYKSNSKASVDKVLTELKGRLLSRVEYQLKNIEDNIELDNY